MNYTPGNEDIEGPRVSGNGYADQVVQPPEGTMVAEGTTSRCDQYVQAQNDKSCKTIPARSAVPMGLFLHVNPSLGRVPLECPDKLVVDTW